MSRTQKATATVEAMPADAPDSSAESVRQVLEELRGLAEGDLTVRTTVTTGETGDLARWLNHSIRTLDERVAGISDTSERLLAGAQRTRGLVTELSNANKTHAQEIEGVAGRVSTLSERFAHLRTVAGSVDEASGEIRQAAAESAQAGREAGAGMETVRGAVHDSAKRLKRLAESAQRLGDAVRLVDALATQASVLAVNAAIQVERSEQDAAALSIIAEGLEQLSESSRDASDEIDALARSVQTDTSEALALMEQATTVVVSTTERTEGVAEAVLKVDERCEQLIPLTKEVHETSREHLDETGQLATEIETLVRAMAMTREASETASQSAVHFSEFADVLRVALSGFRLTER